jgi:chromosomal replication initiator protein
MGAQEAHKSLFHSMWESCGKRVSLPPDATTMNAWDEIKQELSKRISAEAFQNWVARTSFRGLTDGRLRVDVPDELTREWLQTEYAGHVQAIIREGNLAVSQVTYEATAGNGFEPGPSTEPLGPAPACQLNPRFSFENFVVGSCNQFAHAAARAVATMPSRTYNPLFIYGGVGMGKTHLMHAIGRTLLEKHGTMRIVYTTSERFMNQMINCIKLDRMGQFHQHFRSADVLLVDDIQILGGKERTQEEFFHTFNELYDHQKQIVISSDSAPKNTAGLVERLRSRFEWGLMVDVQPPDLETKMAILDKKAEQEGIDLPEDVRIFIATKTKSNIRELEGALVKLIAYSSVTGTPITLAMAQQVLKSLASAPERKVTIESILRAVAEKFHLQPAQLKQKTNVHSITYPRQVAMYVVKELTTASLPEIGRAFGGKHHTTVLHSINKIEELRHKDPELNRLIHTLIDSLS